MKRILPLLLATVLLCSHDLYLKMDTYLLAPNQTATLSLYNGTFDNSENTITRDRMLDASVVAHGRRTAIDAREWTDRDSTVTYLAFDAGKAGTYVAGVSTKARNIALTADKFNNYLEHDGVLDMLQRRTSEGLLDQDALESYEKHVKAIYQVGDVTTDDWRTKLGYPIEMVPLTNPYKRYSGQQLAVQLLLDGEPLPEQLVYADYLPTHATPEGHTHDHTHSSSSEAHTHEHEHSEEGHQHTHDERAADTHTHTSGQQLRTDEQGVIIVDLPEDGIYYLRTIHMTTADDSDELTHRSKWATLTFEVTHEHGAGTHTHDHPHDHEAGIPTWVFVLGSVVIVGILFLVFRTTD